MANTTTLTLANGTTRTFPATVRSQIPYGELVDGYDESFADNNSSVTRILYCRWQDGRQFQIDMLGQSLVESGAQAGGVVSNLRRYPPEAHPDYPDLFASSMKLVTGKLGVPANDMSDLAKAISSSVEYGQASASMFNTDTGAVQYNLATYAVSYTTRPYLVFSNEDTPNTGSNAGGGELNRYIELRWKPSADTFSTQGSGFRFVGDDPGTTKIPSPPAKTFGTMQVDLVWYQLPNVPINTILKLLGGVNNSVLSVAYNETEVFGAYAVETLVLNPPDIKFYWTGALDYVCDICFHLGYRPNFDNNGNQLGWNSLFHGKLSDTRPQGFEKIIGSDGTTKLFVPQDFSQLFIMPLA